MQAVRTGDAALQSGAADAAARIAVCEGSGHKSKRGESRMLMHVWHMHNNPLPVGDTVAHPSCIYGEDPEVTSESVGMQINEGSDKLCVILSALSNVGYCDDSVQ